MYTVPMLMFLFNAQVAIAYRRVTQTTVQCNKIANK